MDLGRYFQEALRQLVSSKLRTFLAVLGILVGTASVVAMVSIGLLVQNNILKQFKAMGTNLLSISIQPKNYNNPNKSPFATLTIDSAKNIITASPNIKRVAPYVSSYGSVVYNGHELSGSAVGITPEMYDLAKLNLAKGRFLTYLDVTDNDYFCLIGHQLAMSIKKQGIANPIGTQIRLGQNIFTIVGVLKKWPINWFISADFDQSIIMPLNTAMAINNKAKISNVDVRILNTNLLEATQNAITQYIKVHTIDQQIRITSPKKMIETMEKQQQTMTIFLGLIGGISLLVGGIGVMNIMLVSVAERRREIGIRKAIGARQIDIQMQFLVESITLSLIGGLAGVLLGIVVTYIASLYSKWDFKIFLTPVAVGFFVSVMVGVFFGFYPAKKAAKLDPIASLRAE